MSVRVFIDGAAGTTGLEIRQRLQTRAELSLVALDEKWRKDASARADALNDADMVILCLPDAAARAAVTLIVNPNVRVIDPSSAHRVTESWVFGFPELEAKRREELRHAMRVTNPGCYSTGFLSIMRPLMRNGIVPPDAAVMCNAVSGYSGGGRAMIAEFEDANAPNYSRAISAPMRSIWSTNISRRCAFMRVSCTGRSSRQASGASIAACWWKCRCNCGPCRAIRASPCVHAALADSFSGENLIEVASLSEAADKRTLDAEELKNTNRLKLYVFGNEARRQARVVAVLDNLGKGAAGACVQNLNVMLGWPETAGLV